MKTENPKTRSQEWAQRANECVIRHKESGKTFRDDYVSIAKRLPSLIHSCGLAQALAFVAAKGKRDKPNHPVEPERQLMLDLFEVLVSPNLAEESRNAEVARYLRLSRDSLTAAGWLKRYAEAILE